MLNLSCVICADLFKPSDDVHVTTCGHMFHHTCLIQWLERSKTCPQCRNKCTQRNIVRVYFNLANLDSSRIDVCSLQEQLDNAQLQLKMKEKELNKKEQEIKDLNDLQKKCRKTIVGLETKVSKNEFIILSYADQIKMLKAETQIIEDLRKDLKKAKQELTALEGVSNILTASTADAERMLKNEKDPLILSVWVTTLKRELRQCEQKKVDIRNTLKLVQNDMRKETESKRKLEERISQLESENYQMQMKLKTFESASTSVSSTTGDQPSDSTALNKSVLAVKEDRRSTISPTIKENIKRIETSNSPYLNIKSSSVGLAPTLFKRIHDATTASITSTNNSLATLKISPIKIPPSHTKSGLSTSMSNGTLRKTTSDLGEKYTIFKKPRLGLYTTAVGANATMKPLASNFVFNGFGGTEKVNPYLTSVNGAFASAAERTKLLNKTTSSKNNATLNDRLKSGSLRSFKVSK